MGFLSRARTIVLYAAEANLSGLVWDRFRRGDSATSLGTTPTGHAWTANYGTWGITSKKAYQVTGGVDGQQKSNATVDPGVADGSVICKFATMVAGKESLVVFRYLNQSNLLLVVNTDAAGAVGNNIALWKRDDGAWSNLAAAAYTWANGDKVKVILSGTSIIVQVNGVQKLSVSNAFNQTQTKHGIGTSGDVATVARWDDFQVTA